MSESCDSEAIAWSIAGCSSRTVDRCDTGTVSGSSSKAVSGWIAGIVVGCVAWIVAWIWWQLLEVRDSVRIL